MTITTPALRELHRIHRQLTDLRERLDRGPKQVQAAEANVRKMETELQESREAAKRLRIQADERQLQLKEREARIKDLRGKLNACSTNKEYQTLKEQIAADEQANSVLGDEILDALVRLEELNAKLKVADASLERAKQEGERLVSRVTHEQLNLETDRARLQAELKHAESALPEDLRLEYDRIARVRGEEALAQVDGQICGHCFQTLTTQTMSELYLSHPVFCKSCGCLLYLAKDREQSQE
jgi:hypothetical protein